MLKPTDYTNGSGEEGFPNEETRGEAANRARRQGLTQVHCAILAEPMTFRFADAGHTGAIQINATYRIAYKGR